MSSYTEYFRRLSWAEQRYNGPIPADVWRWIRGALLPVVTPATIVGSQNDDDKEVWSSHA